jgi:signal transduction histidine kinase
VIEVRDSGIGIDAALLAHVFEPFSAAGGDIAWHSSGQFEFGSRGLGLGLALAKAAVDAHGGSIEIASEVGKGTTVRVILR